MKQREEFWVRSLAMCGDFAAAHQVAAAQLYTVDFLAMLSKVVLSRIQVAAGQDNLRPQSLGDGPRKRFRAEAIVTDIHFLFGMRLASCGGGVRLAEQSSERHASHAGSHLAEKVTAGEM